MIPAEVLHAGGVRTVLAYTMPALSREYALRAEVVRGSGEHRVRGDRLALPGPLALAFEVSGATLADAYAVAEEVLTECESATVVRWHYGSVVVTGVLSAVLEPVGPASVRVLVELSPDTATVEALEALTMDSIDFTMDSTEVTMDATLMPIGASS